VLIAAGIVVMAVGVLWFAGRPTAPTMPELTGMSFEDALGVISHTNELCLDTVRPSDKGERGVVLDQQPVAGKDLTSGSRLWSVTITLGAGSNLADIKAAARAAPGGTICAGDRAGLFEPTS
jgi:beta-lactam-binding protein with PASTA domain